MRKTVYQRKWRQETRDAIREFKDKLGIKAKKMMRCLCSATCRKMFLTDCAHRIWPPHASRVDGLVAHGFRFGGGKGKAW